MLFAIGFFAGAAAGLLLMALLRAGEDGRNGQEQFEGHQHVLCHECTFGLLFPAELCRPAQAGRGGQREKE